MAEVVATSAAVSSSASRTAKVQALAATIARLRANELAPGVAFLTGRPQQGRIGVGWASLAGLTTQAPAAEATLTVADVHAAIDALAALGGTRSAAARASALRSLLARATAPEADFVRRLLTGEVRQGALEGLVSEAVARAAGVPVAAVRRAAMLAGDLPLVAGIALSGGIPSDGIRPGSAAAALAAIALRPLSPVQPMLAATAPDAAGALDLVGGPASVEWKLDGARIQAHRVGDEVRLFTRNLNDVTSRFPAIVAVVLGLDCTSVVLDGEVIGVRGADDRPEPFQDTMSRFGRHGDPAPSLVVRFFDCLHLDGDDLVDRPLVDRAAVLERLAPRHRVPSIVTADGAEAQAFFEQSLAAGHEGVMVKGASSLYEAGRRGGLWRKVKPVVTFDLVVLGAEWGHGRRRGWLSNLHLGARDPDATGPDEGFVMVGKTFKGLTDELLAWQTERFLELEVSRSDHAVVTRPELVVEIAVDGVQRSTRYGGGVTLRFARVRRYRPDKHVGQSDTIASLRGLLAGN